MTITEVINNYINGNLTDAKEGAKHVPEADLYSELRVHHGYKAATAIYRYLLGRGTFQEAADAEFEEKKNKLRAKHGA